MSDRAVWRLEAENERLRDEVARLRLTDEEREAVDAALGWVDDRDTKTIATLRGLLARLGGKECTA